MASYPLSIITPEGKKFDGLIESVIAPGVEGFFEILNDHAPYLASLKKGMVTLKQKGQRSYFAIGSGVLEVNLKHEVLLLSDFAIPALAPQEIQSKLKEASAS